MNNLVMRLSKRNMSIRSDWSLQAASGVVLIYAVLTTVAAAPPSSSVVQDTEVLEDAVVVDREEPLKAVESLQAPVYVTIIQRHKQADIFKPTENSKEYHHSNPYPESLTYGDLYHKKPNYYEVLPVKSYNQVYSKTVHSDPYSQPQTINNDKYDTGKPHSLYHSLYHPYDSPKSTVSDAEYEHAYVKAKSHYAKDSYYKEPEYNSHVPIYSISHEPISIPVYEHAHEFVHPSYNHHDYKFKKGNYEEVSEHDSHGIQYRYAPQLDYHKHEKSDVSDTYDDRKQSYPKSFTFLKSPGYDYVSKPRQEIRSEIKYIEPTIKPLHSKTHETEHHTSDLDELIHDSIFSPFAAKDASTSAPGKRIRDASNPKTGLNDYDVQLLVDPKHGNKVYRLPQIHQDSLMTQLYGIRHPRLAQYYSPSPIHSPHTIVSSKPITQSFENTALHHIEPNFTYKASPEIHHGLVPKYENQDYTPTPRRARSHVQTPALHADDLAYKEYQDLSVARLPAVSKIRISSTHGTFSSDDSMSEFRSKKSLKSIQYKKHFEESREGSKNSRRVDSSNLPMSFVIQNLGYPVFASPHSLQMKKSEEMTNNFRPGLTLSFPFPAVSAAKKARRPEGINLSENWKHSFEPVTSAEGTSGRKGPNTTYANATSPINTFSTTNSNVNDFQNITNEPSVWQYVEKMLRVIKLSSAESKHTNKTFSDSLLQQVSSLLENNRSLFKNNKNILHPIFIILENHGDKHQSSLETSVQQSAQTRDSFSKTVLPTTPTDQMLSELMKLHNLSLTSFGPSNDTVKNSNPLVANFETAKLPSHKQSSGIKFPDNAHSANSHSKSNKLIQLLLRPWDKNVNSVQKASPTSTNELTELSDQGRTISSFFSLPDATMNQRQNNMYNNVIKSAVTQDLNNFSLLNLKDIARTSVLPYSASQYLMPASTVQFGYDTNLKFNDIGHATTEASPFGVQSEPSMPIAPHPLKMQNTFPHQTAHAETDHRLPAQSPSPLQNNERIGNDVLSHAAGCGCGVMQVVEPRRKFAPRFVNATDVVQRLLESDD